MNICRMKFGCGSWRSRPVFRLLYLCLVLSAWLSAPGASGVELRAVREQPYVNFSWDPLDAKLQEALTLNGPWQTVNTAAVNSCRYRMTGARKFFRLTQPGPGKKWLTVAAITISMPPARITSILGRGIRIVAT